MIPMPVINAALRFGVKRLWSKGVTVDELRKKSRLADAGLKLVASKISVARVDARVKVWPGMPHVFQLIGMLPQTKQSLDEIGAFITGRCGLPRQSSTPANAQSMAAPS